MNKLAKNMYSRVPWVVLELAEMYSGMHFVLEK